MLDRLKKLLVWDNRKLPALKSSDLLLLALQVLVNRRPWERQQFADRFNSERPAMLAWRPLPAQFDDLRC